MKLSSLHRSGQAMLAFAIAGYCASAFAASKDEVIASTTSPESAPVAQIMAHPVRSDRLLRHEDGFEIEYAADQEAYVSALLQALKRWYSAHPVQTPDAIAATQTPPPLSPEEFLSARSAILQTMNRHLSLQQPPRIQGYVYDTFAQYYASWMILKREILPQLAGKILSNRSYAIWDREEVIRRMAAGEKISGFSYSPETKQLSASAQVHFDLESLDGGEIASKAKDTSLLRSFNYEVRDGVAEISASLALQAKQAETTGLANRKTQEKLRAALPAIINQSDFTAPAGTRAHDGSMRSPEECAAIAVSNLDEISVNADSSRREPRDSGMVMLILHESIEAAVVDRYLGSADRRWFCDGVANYVSWLVACERGGTKFGAQVYDLPSQLARYAALQPQINLASWPAVENQKEQDQKTQLDKARYAFATRAVAIMHEQGGPDILPKIFTELGKTPRKKASMKTVGKIYQRLTGHSLSEVLREAETRPIPEGHSTSAKRSEK